MAPVLVALAVMVVWGATPVATRMAVTELDPILVALLRTVIGGLSAIPIALALRIRPPKNPRAVASVLVAGGCGFVVFPIVYSVGQQMTSALHGGLILAGLPVLTGLYAGAFERTWPKGRWLVGCAFALAGEAWLIFARAGGAEATGNLAGDLIIVGTAFFVALGYVVGARAARHGSSSLGTTLWGIGASGLLLAPWLGLKLATEPWPDASAAAWGATLFLALVTSILGYIGWYWSLAKGGIARIATMQFLQPVSGLVLAIVILGEEPTPSLLLAAALILGGIIVAQRGR
jgi:drug/metabolite transporter (DMT)-like permease